jgi:hypothetical protein
VIRVDEEVRGLGLAECLAHSRRGEGELVVRTISQKHFVLIHRLRGLGWKKRLREGGKEKEEGGKGHTFGGLRGDEYRGTRSTL